MSNYKIPTQQEKLNVSNKAKQIVGWNISELTELFLSSQGEGQLKFKEFIVFWTEVCFNSNDYLFILLKELYDYYNSEKSIKYKIDCLSHTIMFVAMYYETKIVKMNIESHIEKFNELEDKMDEHAREVIYFLKSLSTQNYDDIKYYVEKCCLLYNTNEMKNFEKFDAPYMYGIKYSRIEKINLYQFIQNFAKNSKEKRSYIFKTCIELLNNNPVYIQESEKIRCFFILALFHIIESLLQFIISISDLKYIKEILKQYYFMPNPIGNTTNNLLSRIDSEIRFPSYNLVRRIISSSNSYRVDGNILVQISKKNLCEFKRVIASPIILLMEEDSIKSKYFSKILFLNDLNKENICKKTGLPIKIIFTLILYILNSNVGVDDNNLENMKWLTKENIYSIFKEIINIMNRCLSLKPEEVINFREQELNTIKKKIHSIALNNASNPSNDFKTLKWPDKFLEDFYVEPMPFEYIAIKVKNIKKNENEKNKCLSDIYTQFKSIFELFSNQINQENSINLKLVICGGNSLIHSTIRIYHKIMMESPNLIKATNLKFYTVPFEKNSLAAFIARHDPWYNRHVYMPFVEPQTLIPTINFKNLSNETFLNQKKELIPHAVLYRNLINHYVQEANNQIEIHIFEVRCWNSMSKYDIKYIFNNKPNEMGKFFENVKIYIDDKGKRNDIIFDYFEADIKCTPVDIFGNTKKEIIDKECSIKYVVLNNMYYGYDDFFQADPRNNYLEMVANINKNDNNKNEKNKSFVDSRQHVNSFSICLNSRSEGKMNLTVDGIFYGNYDKIEVSPVKKDNNFTFKTSCYFPMLV